MMAADTVSVLVDRKTPVRKLAASVTGPSILSGDGCHQTCHRKLERMPELERELKCFKYSVVVAGRFSTKRPPVQSPEGRPAAKKQDLV